ncbi:MAG: phospholipase [Euryarchaeota archaeon]|nr:phospholipase [Euryarchaeota archaeon]
MRARTEKFIIVLIVFSFTSLLAYGVYEHYFALYPGDEAKSITVDGLTRTFIVHIPTHINSTPALLIALHGGGGNGRDMEKLTRLGFNNLADKYGFLVIYPDGIGRHWNDGRNLSQYETQRDNVNDVKFISMLIDWAIKNYNVNASQVFVTGMSNGALMSYRLAYEIPDKITAIAPVDGSIPLNIYLNETPRGQLPVLMINNVADPILPWDGGAPHFGSKKLGKVIGVEATAAFWAKVDNCSLVVAKKYLPDKDPNDGTRAWERMYENNATGMVVELIGIDGGGHTWPDGYHYLPSSMIGRTSNDINACQVIWSFFQSV